ncbi:hypothetical protein [Phascolarctobacterium sp.]|uniref:hypothetical protein n=1 Tax=Phascolarctobacterium sp. TaxID=2049039 RepID=UPI00386D79F3
MAVKLSSGAILAANKVNSDGAWLFLLEIQLADGDVIRIARNNEDVMWNDQLWQAFPFSLGEIKNDDKGTLSSLEINVDNTTRDLEYYLQNGAGGTGAKVILRCVCSTALAETTPELEEHFTVKNTAVTASNVKFTLGNSYPSRSRRPWERYMKNNCPFRYKGVKCGYSGDLETCNHTLSDCRKHSNSVRFGGFPGIPAGGLYV